MTADWNAPADKRWTIPVGLDAGKAFQVGAPEPAVRHLLQHRACGRRGQVARSFTDILIVPQALSLASILGRR